MITLERMLKHMAWANQHVLNFLVDLPDEALSAHVVNPDWNVAEIVGHIVSAADRYGVRLTGIESTDIARPSSMNDVRDLIPLTERFDARLLAAAADEDAKVLVRHSDGDFECWRSTILSQAVHHATEHRAQLASALEAKGFAAPDLDDIDLWAFETCSSPQ